MRQSYQIVLLKTSDGHIIDVNVPALEVANVVPLKDALMSRVAVSRGAKQHLDLLDIISADVRMVLDDVVVGNGCAQLGGPRLFGYNLATKGETGESYGGNEVLHRHKYKLSVM